MRNDKWLAVVTMFLATTIACAAEDDADTTSLSGSIGESSNDTDATMTASMTGMVSVTASTTDSTTDAATDTDATTGNPVEPMPDGASCTEDVECESGNCYFISILGGICGECNADEDCADGGCSLPNPLAMPPVGARCNMGEPGAGCETMAVCQDGFLCETILEAPGILEVKTCSACGTDADCENGELCSPTFDVLNISGQKVCVAPGTVPNGDGCDHLGSGDLACMSGLCATVDIMQILQLGVCGDCGVDADCTAPDICLPADIDIATGVVTPPLCGPPA